MGHQSVARCNPSDRPGQRHNDPSDHLSLQTPGTSRRCWPRSTSPFLNRVRSTLDKALPYFENNAERMRYGRFRELGMFVGSGVVEAGCKTVIGQRLKLSGMRWSIPGTTATITLRCAEGSDRWDQICQDPHNQIAPA